MRKAERSYKLTRSSPTAPISSLPFTVAETPLSESHSFMATSTSFVHKTESKIYVKNIDENVSDEELLDNVSQCSTITSAIIMCSDKGSTPEDANKAVNTFHGK
ncbi:hypothetical protein Lal_00019291 [Lupinus albus]|nr:hypothetical protein Lal_00019291 [Lupinus albus]